MRSTFISSYLKNFDIKITGFSSENQFKVTVATYFQIQVSNKFSFAFKSSDIILNIIK